MWEFSLNLKTENFELAKFIHNNISAVCAKWHGVVTSVEEGGYISILIAVKEQDKEKTQSYLTNCIIEVICTVFKSSFLDSNLFLPTQDPLGMNAFKKALLNFDKETDRYLVRKALKLEKDLFLESFYQFKLSTLKAKWAELVTLANENREYLTSTESFIDLLKFLVDNLEICEEEISIYQSEDLSYQILVSDKLYQNRVFSEESLVSSIIDLSPQKINLYFDEDSQAINLLHRLFEERITDKKHNIIKHLGKI